MALNTLLSQDLFALKLLANMETPYRQRIGCRMIWKWKTLSLDTRLPALSAAPACGVRVMAAYSPPCQPPIDCPGGSAVYPQE